MTTTLGPRVVVAWTHGGVGKTTVTTGIAAALSARGRRVATAKVGPDYIDPGYHELVTGRPGRNLDPWLCGQGAIGPLAGRAQRGCELLVVEGVMGLFDGTGETPDPSFASTAHVAQLLDAPVILVVDAAAMSTSVAALVSGFRDYARDVRLAGVILNRVGSNGHEQLLRAPSRRWRSRFSVRCDATTRWCCATSISGWCRWSSIRPSSGRGRPAGERGGGAGRPRRRDSGRTYRAVALGRRRARPVGRGERAGGRRRRSRVQLCIQTTSKRTCPRRSTVSLPAAVSPRRTRPSSVPTRHSCVTFAAGSRRDW